MKLARAFRESQMYWLCMESCPYKGISYREVAVGQTAYCLNIYLLHILWN